MRGTESVLTYTQQDLSVSLVVCYLAEGAVFAARGVLRPHHIPYMRTVRPTLRGCVFTHTNTVVYERDCEQEAGQPAGNRANRVDLLMRSRKLG